MGRGRNGASKRVVAQPFSVSSLELIAVQTQSEFTRPGLIIRKSNVKQLYYRQLGNEGNHWEPTSGDWTASFFAFGAFSGIRIIKAAVRVNSDKLWLVSAESSNSANPTLIVMLYDLRLGDNTITALKGAILDGTEFVGTLPVREDVTTYVGSQINTIYVFYRDFSGSHYRRFSSDLQHGPAAEALADVIGIPPHSGSGSTGQQILVYNRDKNAGEFYMYKYAEAGDARRPPPQYCCPPGRTTFKRTPPLVCGEPPAASSGNRRRICAECRCDGRRDRVPP